MKVFRTEALMDVILAAVAIILVFLMLIRPAQQASGFYRQASVAVGCFAGEDGVWNEEFLLYTRNATEDGIWKAATEVLPAISFRNALKAAIVPDAGYTRIAIMVDPHSAICADRSARGNGAAIWSAIRLLPDIEETRDWTFATEVLPCIDRSFCEGLLGLSGET